MFFAGVVCPQGRMCVFHHAMGQTPPQETPPRQTTPWADTPTPRADTPEMATAVDGTHPTRMHSCYL